jgi:hypothetical protein
LLLPGFLIEQEIGRGSRVDSIEMVVDLADVASVSTEVALRCLAEHRSLRDVDYALLMIEAPEGGPMVTKAACIGGFFSTFNKPRLYQEPPSWVCKIAPALISEDRRVHRVPRDARWDYVSRAIVKNRHPRQVLVEIRLDPAT